MSALLKLYKLVFITACCFDVFSCILYLIAITAVRGQSVRTMTVGLKFLLTLNILPLLGGEPVRVYQVTELSDTILHIAGVQTAVQ